MLCEFYLNLKNLRQRKKQWRNWREFGDWIPEMSYNAALLKNSPIVVLSKQVCFFLLFYLYCEAKGTGSLLRGDESGSASP